jgi:hypothetical protein
VDPHFAQEPGALRGPLEIEECCGHVVPEHWHDEGGAHRLLLRARCRWAALSAMACRLALGHVPVLLLLRRRLRLGSRSGSMVFLLHPGVVRGVALGQSLRGLGVGREWPTR